jgi:hypothetical protein
MRNLKKDSIRSRGGKLFALRKSEIRVEDAEIACASEVAIKLKGPLERGRLSRIQQPADYRPYENMHNGRDLAGPGSIIRVKNNCLIEELDRTYCVCLISFQPNTSL